MRRKFNIGANLRDYIAATLIGRWLAVGLLQRGGAEYVFRVTIGDNCSSSKLFGRD